MELQPPTFNRSIIFKNDLHAAVWFYYHWKDFRDTGPTNPACCAQAHYAPPAEQAGDQWCKSPTNCLFCRTYDNTDRGTPQGQDLINVLKILLEFQHCWMGKTATETVQTLFDWCASDTTYITRRSTPASWGHVVVQKPHLPLAANEQTYYIWRTIIQLEELSLIHI